MPELIGRDVYFLINSTRYNLQGNANDNTTLTEANNTASGDKVERSIAIRIAGTYDGQAISTDLALIGLRGSQVTFAVMDDATTVFGPVDATLEVQWSADLNGMQQFALKVRPLELPSQYTALAAL